MSSRIPLTGLRERARQQLRASTPGSPLSSQAELANRSTHPRLYWFVTAVWAVTALLMVVEDFPR